jgi:hypothetical protein
MTKTVRGAAGRLRRAARELMGTGKRAESKTGNVKRQPKDEHQRQFRRIRAGVRDTPQPKVVPARGSLRVAVAASSRLLRGLAWEWDQIDLGPTSWADQLAIAAPELVLIEVQAGAVPGWGDLEGGPVELATAAREQGVAVIVWVTSSTDPDAASALMSVATAIFVADASAVPAWRERWSDIVIAALAPAAAPHLHSPALGGPLGRRLGQVAMILDGPELDEESSIELETMLPTLAKMRALPKFHLWRSPADPAAALPAATKRSAVVGALSDPADPVVDQYRVLVDMARCAPDSSWTLVDAAAAQTAVVTLPRYSATLPADIRAHVGTADEAIGFGREIIARVNHAELRDREALQLHRAVLAGHTFSHRVDTILTALGGEQTSRTATDRSVSIVVPTNREHEIDNVLLNAARQTHVDIELILVLHGLDLNQADLRARAAEQQIDRFQVLQADASVSLGALMNLGIEAANGRYVAKMDDDNFYGRHYLTDLVNAFTSTDAGVVGKWSHYVWLQSINAVVLRYSNYQHCYNRLVQGGSIVVETELAKDLRFSDIPRAVDTDFLNRIKAAGVKTYSADRFNFVSIRGNDHRQHTWKITDTAMMTGSAELVFYGDPRPHVDV